MTVERGENFIHNSEVKPLPCAPIMICHGQIDHQTRSGGKVKGTYRGSPCKT